MKKTAKNVIIIFIFLILGISVVSAGTKATISGCFKTAPYPSSVSLYLWPRIVSADYKWFTPLRTFTASVINGQFELSVDSLEAPSYISFGWMKDQWGQPFESLSLYLLEAGDNIQMTISPAKPMFSTMIESSKGDSLCINCADFSFSGKGAEKYNCRFEMDRLADSLEVQWAEKASKFKISADQPTIQEDLDLRRQYADFCYYRQMKYLDKYREQLTPLVFDLLSADILSKAGYIVSSSVYSVLYKLKKETELLYSRDKSRIAAILQQLDSITLSMDPDMLAGSAAFSKYILTRFSVEEKFNSGESVHAQIRDKYTGELRDRLMIANVLGSGSRWDTGTQEKAERDILHLTVTPFYKELAQRLLNNHKVGSKVYDFALPDSSGNIVRLSDFRGKVVFVDFWFVGCGGCSGYYKEVLKETEEVFRNNEKVVFITISVDVNKKKWLAAVHGGEYTSLHVVNLHTNPLGTNDPVIKQFNVRAYPHPLLIDKEGNIFSDSEKELRAQGVEGLARMINKALAYKAD